MTDEQAMWRVQTQDDHRAFARLVERWETPIRNLCARMTGDVHRGEDLKQDVFTRVFEKRQAYQPSQRFSTWMWRIALNLCYDEARRVKRRPEVSLEADGLDGAESSDFPTPELTPDAWLEQREQGELVRQALRQVPELYRTVLVLRHYERLKLREIAEVLEVPEGTVNSRMAEGLAQLTRLLEGQFDQLKGTKAPAKAKPRREILSL